MQRTFFKKNSDARELYTRAGALPFPPRKFYFLHFCVGASCDSKNNIKNNNNNDYKPATMHEEHTFIKERESMPNPRGRDFQLNFF